MVATFPKVIAAQLDKDEVAVIKKLAEQYPITVHQLFTIYSPPGGAHKAEKLNALKKACEQSVINLTPIETEYATLLAFGLRRQ